MFADQLLSRRGVLLLAALLLAFAGRHAFRSMPRSLEPAVEAPFAAIELQLPGASVGELETLLTTRVESELLALPDVVSLRSETRDGAVVLFVELPGDSAARESAFGRIEERLAALRADLATEFIGLKGPNLLRPPARFPELLVAVAAAPSATGASATGAAPVAAARLLAERLRALPEVAHVESVGEPLTRIVLTYDDRDLIDTGLTPMMLREYLRSQSFTAPGGYVDRGETLAPVETAARLRSVDDLVQLPVRDPDDGATVSLGRILDVERESLAPTPEEVKVSDRAAVVLAVTRRNGADLDGFSAAVRATIDRTSREAAPGAPGAADGKTDSKPSIETTVIVAQSDPVAREIDGFGSNLIESFVLLLGLLVISLGFRSGLAVAVVVPLVVAASFVLFHLLGLGIDFVLLSSLVLVLGILVDNHIVIAERIHRLRDEGLSAPDAISRALRELTGPLATATATNVCGFLPIWLTDHFVGEYVRPLFFVVLASLAVSLAFSVFVTPLLLRRGTWTVRAKRPDHDRMAWYTRLLERLSRPGRATLVALATAGVTLLAVVFLQHADQVFFPTSSQAFITIDVAHAQGTNVDRTRTTVAAITKSLQDTAGKDIETCVSFVGRSVPPFQASLTRRVFEPHYAQLLVKLRDGTDLAAFESRFRGALGNGAGDALIRIRPVRLGAELEWPVAIRLRGEDDEIVAAAEEVKAKLAELGCRNVGADRASRITKLRIEPDRTALTKKSLTAADLTAAMHAVVHGLPVFEITEAGGRVPVVLRAKQSRKDSLETLKEAYVYPAKGEPSLLYEVARVVTDQAFPIATRDRGRPSLTIRGEASDPARDFAVEREVDAWLATLRAAHPGIECEVDGIYASSSKANRALLDAVPWAALAVLLLLLVTSRSVGETLLVIATIPLSFIGVALALLVTGEPFSFMVLVGMIALAGLVLNNSIVLVASLRGARLRYVPADGDLRTVLVAAAKERFRPLVLTTLCSIISMAVLYESGGAMWRPLAATIMSGLLFATLMVVTVLPAVYIACASAGSPPAPRASPTLQPPSATTATS